MQIEVSRNCHEDSVCELGGRCTGLCGFACEERAMKIPTDGFTRSVSFFLRLLLASAWVFLLSPAASFGSVALPASSSSVAIGWNLLGNSSTTSLNLAATFGDASKVMSVWKWNATTANWAFYTPTQADGGASYAASKGFDSMTSVGAGEGFWVSAKTAFTATFPAGTAVESASFKTLPTGWNLIAIGDNKTPSAFNDSLSTTPPAAGTVANNYTSLWAWDEVQSKWYFYAPSIDASGELATYTKSKGYIDFGATGKKLGQGIGFWVNKPNLDDPFALKPLQSGVTTTESKSLTAPPGVGGQVSLTDGTSIIIPPTVNEVSATLLRKSNTLDLSGAGVAATGSLREVAFSSTNPVPDNFSISQTIPAAEYGSINTDTLTVVRIGDLIREGQVVSNATTYLVATRAANGDLKVTDPYIGDTLANPSVASGGVTAMSAKAIGTAAATPSPVYGKYVIGTYQAEINWNVQPQLVRMVPNAGEINRIPLSSISQADQAVELKKCAKNVVVLVHGHNEAELGGQNPASDTVGAPWLQDYKRDVWTNLYGKYLSDYNTPEKNADCVVFYEYIYPSYRSAFLYLGDDLAKRLAKEFKPQIDTKKTFNLFIVAHSMGGLVSRTGIQKFSPELHTALQKLITWGSPHHGSPLTTMRYTLGAPDPYDLSAAQGDAWRNSFVQKNFRPFNMLLKSAMSNLAIDTPGTRDLRWDGHSPLTIQNIFTRSKYQTSSYYDLANGAYLYNNNLASLNASDYYGKGSSPKNLLSKSKYHFMYGITSKAKTEITSAQIGSFQWQYDAYQLRTHKRSDIAKGAFLNSLMIGYPSGTYLGVARDLSDGSSPIESMAAEGIDGTRENLGDIDHAEYYGAPDAPGKFTRADLATFTANETMVNLELRDSAYICPPVISAVTSSSGVSGSAATIIGIGFGASKGTSTVTFNGLIATVTSWSNTQIVITIPAGFTAGEVVVTVGGWASDGKPFATIALSPNSGTYGTTVTITGIGFGKSLGTVTFNGVAATSVYDWSDTLIRAIVPTRPTNVLNVVDVLVKNKTSGVEFHGSFTIPSDCIEDALSGLCWDKTSQRRDWASAATYCAEKGKRLPTVNELVLFATEGEIKFTDALVFFYGKETNLLSRLTSRGYDYASYLVSWSSTPKDATFAYAVDFNIGIAGGYNKSVASYLRCVKSYK